MTTATIVKRGDSWRDQIRKTGEKTLSASSSKKALAEKWVHETELANEARLLKNTDPYVGDLFQKYID